MSGAGQPLATFFDTGGNLEERIEPGHVEHDVDERRMVAENHAAAMGLGIGREGDHSET